MFGALLPPSRPRSFRLAVRVVQRQVRTHYIRLDIHRQEVRFARYTDRATSEGRLYSVSVTSDPSTEPLRASALLRGGFLLIVLNEIAIHFP